MGKDFEFTSPSIPVAVKVKYPFKILPRGYVVNIPQYDEFMKVVNGKKNKTEKVTLCFKEEDIGKIGTMNIILKDKPTPGSKEYNISEIFM